jgi:hypothetical protein
LTSFWLIPRSCASTARLSSNGALCPPFEGPATETSGGTPTFFGCRFQILGTVPVLPGRREEPHPTAPISHRSEAERSSGDLPRSQICSTATRAVAGDLLHRLIGRLRCRARLPCLLAPKFTVGAPLASSTPEALLR